MKCKKPQKTHHEPKASLSVTTQTGKEFDILEGMQRTAQEESADRAFSYLHKMHRYKKQRTP